MRCFVVFPFVAAALLAATLITTPCLSAEPKQALEEMGFRFIEDINYAEIGMSESFNLQEAIPLLAKIPTLSGLHIDSCPKIKNLDGIKKLTQISRIMIGHCNQLESLTGLKGHPSLEDVHFDSCPKIENANGLDGLRKLKRIELVNCSGLQSVKGMRNLPALREVYISGANVQNLIGLGQFPQVEKLELEKCQNLKSLQGVQAFPALKGLRIQNCPIQRLTEIETLKQLGKIEMNATELKSLTGIQALPKLRVVSVTDSELLTDISALGPATSLVQLECVRNPNLKDLGALETSKTLLRLKIEPRYVTKQLIPALKSLEVVLLEVGPDEEVPRMGQIAPKVQILSGKKAMDFYRDKWETVRL